MPAERSLYERLGGAEAVETVVDEFYDRVLTDEALRPYFDETDTTALREHQTAFISAITGGPKEYTGQRMAKAHADLGITDEAFDRVASHLDASLRECGIEREAREELLEAVESLREEVVTA